MPRLHSSRRVSALKESDYDHAIDLVDHDSPPPSPRPLSANGVTSSPEASPRVSTAGGRPSLSSLASRRKGKGVQTGNGRAASAGRTSITIEPGKIYKEDGPSIEVEGKS